MGLHTVQLMTVAVWNVALPALITAVVLLLIRRWQRFRVLQGLGYRVPPHSFLYGHADRLLGRSGLDEARRLLAEYGVRYGRRGATMAVYVGATPHLWTTDPDLIHELCVRRADQFPDRPANGSPLTDELQQTLLTLKGARWRRVRSVLSPAFTAAKLRGMAPLMADATGTFLQLLEEDRAAGRASDFYSGFQQLTLEVICRAALAMDVRCQRDTRHPLVQTVSALVAGVPLVARLRQLQPLTGLVRPLLRALGATGRLVRHNETMAAWLRGVVAHREAAAAGPETALPKDVLQLLLDARRSSADREPLSEDELISNAFIFVLAGYETTRTALSFTSYLLAAHLAVQQRLGAEVTEQLTAGPDGELDCEQVLSLPYLEQVVQESLRLFPPIPAMFGRRVARPAEVGGVHVPAGAVVSVSVFCLHRDPELWPEPERFDPERFSAAGRARQQSGAHLPFGLGPRHCIGSRFALLQMKLVLCHLLRRYRLLPPLEPLEPVLAAPFLAPASGKIELRVEPR
ncbi:thromboxane-A synthase-like [Amphibalanus amphitrite]|uniref:thromboxane-A synthase-like n=1 Tax=Amphibalanus amphitrite TaxID=1232801 RepID=UPI001C908433|nr:thromboxane-A synthase-like [Amphibalanus amphitrite]